MKRMIENLRFDRTVIQPGAETKVPHAQPLMAWDFSFRYHSTAIS